MKNILAIAILMIPAYWTGKSETFTSVTGKPAIRCEYKVTSYPPFWRTFAGWSCPTSVDVQ